MFFSVFFNTTNKNLFHSEVGNCSLRAFSWDSNLWFHSLPSASSGLALTAASTCSAVANVRSPKPLDRSRRHTVCGHSPLLTVAPQTPTGCVQAQTSDGELPRLFGPLGDSDSGLPIARVETYRGLLRGSTGRKQICLNEYQDQHMVETLQQFLNFLLNFPLPFYF